MIGGWQLIENGTPSSSWRKTITEQAAFAYLPSMHFSSAKIGYIKDVYLYQIIQG
jgi:hypothetical protein